jgi:RNA polymerase sigma factor for flagellar operon FliA
LREQVIHENLRLVKYVVGRLTGQLPPHVEREDLFSAGILGLIKAVDRFDPDRGVKFETYASTVVRGEVMESLRAKDWAPRSLRRKLRRLAEVVRELEGHLRSPPEEEELAEGMEMTLPEYHRFLSDVSAASVASLEEVLAGEEPVDEYRYDSGDQSDDFADPAAILEKTEMRRLVAEAVATLPEREQTIMSLYYEQELTLKEIGQVMGVTESRICQIHTQACARLKAHLQLELAPC